MKDVESARGMYYDDDDSRPDRRNAVLEVPVTDFELSVRAAPRSRGAPSSDNSRSQ